MGKRGESEVNKDILKQRICQSIDDYQTEIIDFAKNIASEPELGFKEVKTAAKTAAVFDKLGIKYESGLAITGIKGHAAGNAAGPTVAIFGEMDAVGCPDSPAADPLTGAAHACGHNIQMGVLIGAAYGLMKSGVLENLSGNVVFFGVPAEEFVEIEYRNQLRAAGKLHYLGGKQELIYRDAFADIDMAMQMHADKNSPQATIAIGDSSNGFIGKMIRYIGKEAHAADAPELGVNALNAAMIGLMGINALRETFRDQDIVRVHPIITKGGDLVNCVPADVRMETYVRAKSMTAMEKVHLQVDNALRAGGSAVGAETVIQTLPGYMPLICNHTMNELFATNAKIADPQAIICDAGHFSASTDMGDVSQMMPVIHPFIGGTQGALHTREFCVTDYTKACLMPAKAMALTIVDLLSDNAQAAKQIINDFKPALTRQDYIKQMDSYFTE